MALPRGFDAFVLGAPRAVMARLVADRIVDDELLSSLFQEYAVTLNGREITITHLVQVMLDVACRMDPSVRTGFLRRRDAMTASLPSTTNWIAPIPN